MNAGRIMSRRTVLFPAGQIERITGKCLVDLPIYHHVRRIHQDAANIMRGIETLHGIARDEINAVFGQRFSETIEQIKENVRAAVKNRPIKRGICKHPEHGAAPRIH